MEIKKYLFSAVSVVALSSAMVMADPGSDDSNPATPVSETSMVATSSSPAPAVPIAEATKASGKSSSSKLSRALFRITGGRYDKVKRGGDGSGDTGVGELAKGLFKDVCTGLKAAGGAAKSGADMFQAALSGADMFQAAAPVAIGAVQTLAPLAGESGKQFAEDVGELGEQALEISEKVEDVGEGLEGVGEMGDHLREGDIQGAADEAAEIADILRNLGHGG